MGLDASFYGYEKHATSIELHYWRKNWALHDFIIKKFAGGCDKCQRIYLTLDGVELIQTAIINDELEDYSHERKEEDIEALQKVIDYLEEDKGHWVYYQGSW